MNRLEKINDRIHALRIPYMDIFTTVYFVKTACGTLLFDTASYDRDAEDAIIPALLELGIGEHDLKYIFLSHHHADHAGGLGRLLMAYPHTCVVARSESLREKFGAYTFLSPREGEILLDDLRVVFVTGHTEDSAALYDTRTKTLISGDCLQLYGVFGSGCWGANISFPTEYVQDIQKLCEMELDTILTAHDYHPCGRIYCGKAEIEAALDACLAPLELIHRLIEASPDADAATLCERYNAHANLPRLGAHVIKRYREEVKI